MAYLIHCNGRRRLFVIIYHEFGHAFVEFPWLGSIRPNFLGKSYSRKKTGRSDGFAGWLLLSLERWQLHVCISSQKRPPNQARMDPWPSGRQYFEINHFVFGSEWSSCFFSGWRVASVFISNFTDCPLFGKFAADACCGVGIALIVGASRNKKVRIIQDGTSSSDLQSRCAKYLLPRPEGNFVIFSVQRDLIYKQRPEQIFGASGTFCSTDYTD